MLRRLCTRERWNRFLSYETARKTVIQHWIVGLIHFIFLGAVALYIFGYVMFWNQRYLKRYPVTGDFRYKLIPPSAENIRSTEELNYCRKYLDKAFNTHEHEDQKFLLDDEDPYGTLIKATDTDSCRKECIKSEKSCIGLNFQKEEKKCYHIYASDSRKIFNIEDGITAGYVTIEPSSDWHCMKKQKGKEFLFHENIGNCEAGIKVRKEKEFDLTSPKPGQHSGSFGIFLGFSNKGEKKENCDCSGNDHENCYSNKFIFFPNIEEYELEITHGYVTMDDLRRDPDDDRLSKGSRELNGTLVDQDDNVIQNFEASGTGTATRDRIKIKDILRAADVKSFDEACDGHDNDCMDNKPRHLAHSFRNEGLVIFLRIEYLDGWDRNIRYTYKFDRMEDTDWSIYRTDKQYTALRIPVIITGSVGEFDFMLMIVEFTSSLFLFGIADLFMVYIVFKCFPQRDLYQRAVYQKTKSFHHEHLTEMKKRQVSLWEDDHNELKQSEIAMLAKEQDGEYSNGSMSV